MGVCGRVPCRGAVSGRAVRGSAQEGHSALPEQGWAANLAAFLRPRQAVGQGPDAFAA